MWKKEKNGLKKMTGYCLCGLLRDANYRYHAVEVEGFFFYDIEGKALIK